MAIVDNSSMNHRQRNQSIQLRNTLATLMRYKSPLEIYAAKAVHWKAISFKSIHLIVEFITCSYFETIVSLLSKL